MLFELYLTGRYTKQVSSWIRSICVRLREACHSFVLACLPLLTGVGSGRTVTVSVSHSLLSRTMLVYFLCRNGGQFVAVIVVPNDYSAVYLICLYTL